VEPGWCAFTVALAGRPPFGGVQGSGSVLYLAAWSRPPREAGAARGRSRSSLGHVEALGQQLGHLPGRSAPTCLDLADGLTGAADQVSQLLTA